MARYWRAILHAHGPLPAVKNYMRHGKEDNIEAEGQVPDTLLEDGVANAGQGSVWYTYNPKNQETKNQDLHSSLGHAL